MVFTFPNVRPCNGFVDTTPGIGNAAHLVTHLARQAVGSYACTLARLFSSIPIFSALDLLHAGDDKLPDFHSRSILSLPLYASAVALLYNRWRRLIPEELAIPAPAAVALEPLATEHVIFTLYFGFESKFHEEWVYNSAEIDSSPVVWARALGPEQDARLLRYFGDRSAWLLEVRVGVTPHLAPYSPDSPSQGKGTMDHLQTPGSHGKRPPDARQNIPGPFMQGVPLPCVT